jgi:cysteinyl-tRNA synthetase
MQGKWIMSALVAAALALAVAIAGPSFTSWPRPQLSPRQGMALAVAQSWGYQLQHLDARAIPDDIDVLVVDYSRDGSEQMALSAAKVEQLRARPGRPPRIVLCYMSIGEAESYRYYWRPAWQTSPPAWLGGENMEWRGNFAVRFWRGEWQRLLIVPRPTIATRLQEVLNPHRLPYLDRILEAGFDGVYLDRVDAFAQWLGERASAQTDMITLIERISAYAHGRKSGFLVVAQNGEELLKSKKYRAALDGVAKEDLLYGIEGDGRENSADDVASSRTLLQRARADGLPVLVVEYLSDHAKRAAAYTRLKADGYIPLFATRGLALPPESSLVLGEKDLPRTAPTATR